ncbi:unnamed protein product [Rotaria socialis]|uniref:Uncharacterized protein n=1 Tax=Rotaria socialis TaxID=392032 RepID=A0A821QP95_9BILA|nr:unnamed protein product [Rotaria socialis]CAF4829585.1 unnamed protein product [Rotaria socialis]
MHATRHYTQDYQSNSRNSNSLTFDQSSSSQSYRYQSNYQPPTSTTYSDDKMNISQQRSALPSYGSSVTNNYALINSAGYSSTNSPIRNKNNGTTGTGAVEKTNMMSSENPFYDPARSYGQLNSPRKITSIVSPPKSGSGISKSLNLSDENPFHAIYGNYHYPTQVDPSKRITPQATTIRSTDNKSLSLSDDNPFHSSYERYRYPSQVDPQKRITETPRPVVPLIPIHDLSDDSPFSTYRPSLIREYSTNNFGNPSNSVATSIADWIRNNPAPLSYRPIQVQRPSSDLHPRNDSFKKPSYVSPLSAPRQQQRPSSPPIPTFARTQSQPQPQKVNSSAPLDKNSLNMSPDNPFSDTYGRYHYPSSEEVKAQKRVNERNTRLPEQKSTIDNRTTQITNQYSEYPEPEKKETASDKANNKFTRFDITF